MHTFPQQFQTPLYLKQKSFYLTFFCVSEIYMKFKKFAKKGESPSLSIFEIIDSERSAYLSVWKVLLQKSFG